MRKKAWILLLVCMLTLFETGCGSSSGSATVQNEDESRKKEESPQQAPDQSEEENIFGQQEKSDTDVRKLELTIDLRWNAYEKLRDQAGYIEKLEHGMSEKEIQELVQSEILRCYEENTLLAVEIKTVVLGSLDCTVPSGFSTGEDVMKDYGNYVLNTVSSVIDVQGVIDDIASPQVQELLKNGVEGAVSEYRITGSLEDALQEAADSITYGVAAGIQEQAEAYAVGILDETTFGLFSVVREIPQYDSIEDYLIAKGDEKVGGLIGSLAGITDYDAAPGALFQSITDSASSSAAGVKAFLNQDVITSKEIGELLYEYSQFGNALYTLFQYGGAGYFNWEPNYDKMETLYKRFLRNEVMIEMLSSKGEMSALDIDEELVSEGGGEDAQTLEYIYEKPGLTSQEKELDSNARFGILTARLEELESAIAQLESREASIRELTAMLKEYRLQTDKVNMAYNGILEYSVQNFKALYDEQGIADMQELNSKQHIVGEIAKYTPYGLVLNLLTSATIASSDAYYNSMQTANEAFAKAYQNAVLKAKSSVEALEARTDFYSELVAENEDLWTEYVNMCLLKYMLGDKKIDVEQYGQEAKEDLYLLALQTDAMAKIYGTLYTDPTASNTYAKQYQELMGVVDQEGTGEIANAVSDTECSETLLPVMQAGISAIGAMEQSPMPGMDNKYVMVYRDDNTPGGKIYCCFLQSQLIHAHHQNRWIDIYYSGKGEPLYINGYYVYDGTVLNGTEDMDGAAACEEAQWIRENIWSNDQRNFQANCAEHVKKIEKALSQN